MNNNCKHCIDCTKNTHRDEETKKKLNQRYVESKAKGLSLRTWALSFSCKKHVLL